MRLQVRLAFLSHLLVRMTYDQMFPQDQAMGQVDIFVRSSGQADFWSDTPHKIRLRARLTFLSDLQVRLTFGQMYPPGSGFRSS